VVALPGERIIREGGPPDSMYFVAAGEVQVILRGGPVTLKDGDFFGEGGLLEHRPRNADVISTGYTHLLVLDRKDFDRLLDKRPEVRAAIEAVAAKRAADMPEAAGQ
jgi:CPA1 family monovalent cation:H+ antiporter